MNGGTEMDVREKLIELLTNSQQLDVLDLATGWEEAANYLIAHGVTVQEWISVTERLPEDDSDVLAYLQIGEEGRIYPANYAKGVWFDCIFNTPVTESTTHWMPLPQPPKGE